VDALVAVGAQGVGALLVGEDEEQVGLGHEADLSFGQAAPPASVAFQMWRKNACRPVYSRAGAW
jgi:hypothetical protein